MPVCVGALRRCILKRCGKFYCEKVDGIFCFSPASVTPDCFLHVASSFLKQAFEGEYPKLLRLYNELWRRLQQYSTSLQGALSGTTGLDSSVDISGTEMDSQDLFAHGKQDHK